MKSRISRHLIQGIRDAWAKHKDLDPYEAKWLYVEALLKVRNSNIPNYGVVF